MPSGTSAAISTNKLQRSLLWTKGVSPNRGLVPHLVLHESPKILVFFVLCSWFNRSWARYELQPSRFTIFWTLGKSIFFSLCSKSFHLFDRTTNLSKNHVKSLHWKIKRNIMAPFTNSEFWYGTVFACGNRFKSFSPVSLQNWNQFLFLNQQNQKNLSIS